MSDPRILIPFFETPKEFKPPKKTKPLVHKTKRGRVVYDRKRHFFTTKDLRRILKNILENDQGKKTDFGDFLVEWGEIELMMLEFLASQGGFVGSNPLFDLIRDYVVMLIAGKTEPPAPKKP